MPKPKIFDEGNDVSDDVLTNFIKKLASQQKPEPKPKQKRVISEERKEQLRAQLIKGRENSMKSRSKETKALKVEKEKEVKQPTKAPPTSPIDKKEFLNLHSKIDTLVNHMQEVTTLQKETLEYKKNKRKAKPEVEEEFLIFKPKKEEPKKEEPKKEEPKPTPQPTPQPVQLSKYFTPTFKHRLF